MSKIEYAFATSTKSLGDYFSGLFYLSWNNFFWWFIGISLFFWLLEIIIPWRKKQSIFRKDFFLDGFYMFFNMYILPVIGLNFVANLVNTYFLGLLAGIGITRLDIFNLSTVPEGLQLVILFIVRDFIHFNIHRLLHRVNWMWEFHKVHHSVKEMGFAAHLRFHWVEGVFYQILQFIPLALLGLSVTDFTILYIFTLAIGHSNHSNYYVPLGWFKYILNNPQMHIWHHYKYLPMKYGANFGLTLSLWDYVFNTDYIPNSGRDKELGFTGDEKFPNSFAGQFIWKLK